MLGRGEMDRQLFYHVYQRSLDKSVVFKTSLDALVFVSILFVKARCYKVSIPALCLMDNHFHILARVHSESSLDPFVSESVSLFTRLYNKEHSRRGSLFKGPFGKALKMTDKYIRNCISYINNNPVEAKKCSRIEDYVWNFTAYYCNDYAFSRPVVVRKASYRLKQRWYEVKDLSATNKPLNYTLLRHLFESLSEQEALQLRDLLISRCNPLDYDCFIRYFGTYEKALVAINSFTGSEHQLKEDDRR